VAEPKIGIRTRQRLPLHQGFPSTTSLLIKEGTNYTTTADDSVREQAKLHGFLFLQKPFYLTQLRRMIETA
jgi:hypothetical protein